MPRASAAPVLARSRRARRVAAPEAGSPSKAGILALRCFPFTLLNPKHPSASPHDRAIRRHSAEHQRRPKGVAVPPGTGHEQPHRSQRHLPARYTRTCPSRTRYSAARTHSPFPRRWAGRRAGVGSTHRHAVTKRPRRNLLCTGTLRAGAAADWRDPSRGKERGKAGAGRALFFSYLCSPAR